MTRHRGRRRPVEGVWLVRRVAHDLALVGRLDPERLRCCYRLLTDPVAAAGTRVKAGVRLAGLYSGVLDGRLAESGAVLIRARSAGGFRAAQRPEVRP